MCSRFTLAAEMQDIIGTLEIKNVQYNFSPRYNIAPTNTIAGVLSHDGKRSLQGFH